MGRETRDTIGRLNPETGAPTLILQEIEFLGKNRKSSSGKLQEQRDWCIFCSGGILLSIICIWTNFIFSDIGAVKIASGFKKPIFISSIPNTINHHIILEQRGTIKILKNDQILRSYFLDIRDRVHKPLYPGDEMGLLSLAFDPNFDKNNYIYVHYNDKSDNTIISRFNVFKN